MISFSAYLKGDKRQMQDFLSAMNIKSDNARAHDDASADFGFLSRGENGLLYSSVSGDFDFACDIMLFDMRAEDLDAFLRQASEQVVRLAVPDETKDTPFAFSLFAGNQCSSVEILSDELTEEVKIKLNKGIT